MKNKNIQRIEYFDLLRILATFSVVMLHVSAQNWFNVNINSYEWKIFNIYDSITRWTVPVFIMISGTLFLSKEYNLKSIYYNKILRLIMSFIFWSSIYVFIFNKNDNIFIIINNFIKGENHMWFLFMIIGLYILSPIFKKITESECLTKYFLIIAFIVSFLLPQIINLLLLIQNKYIHVIANAIKINLKNLNLVLGYMGYFVLGYYLNNKNISKKMQYIIYLLGTFGFVSTIFLTNIASNIEGKGIVTFYDNMSINVALEALGVFVFAKYNFKTNSSLKYISKLSFGVYLSHILFLNVLKLNWGVTTLSFEPAISIPLITTLVFLISLLLSGLINNIPILKRYIV